MPKLYSSAWIIKVLEKNGVVFTSQKGSHVKLRKQGGTVLTVVVPANRKEIPEGMFKSILRQSEMERGDFA